MRTPFAKTLKPLALLPLLWLLACAGPTQLTCPQLPPVPPSLQEPPELEAAMMRLEMAVQQAESLIRQSPGSSEPAAPTP
jgi:hypothetical protein